MKLPPPKKQRRESKPLDVAIAEAEIADKEERASGHGNWDDEKKSKAVKFDASELQASIGKLLKFSTFEPEQRYWLETGSEHLNGVFGSKEKGIPYGKVLELSGEEHAGKTLLSTIVAAMAQQDGAGVGRVDLEDSRDDDWEVRLGLDPSSVVTIYPKLVLPKAPIPEDGEAPEKEAKPKKGAKKKKKKLLIPRLQSAEEMFEEMKVGMALLSQKGFKKQFWFLDSIANLRTDMQLEAGTSGQNMRTRNDRAMLLSEVLPELAGLAANYNATVFLLNQLREKPGVMFGDPLTCLSKSVCVYFDDGRVLPIGTVVDQQIKGKVLALDKMGKVTYSRITDWHNHGRTKSINDWVAVKTDGPGTTCGYIRMRLTPTHPVFLFDGKTVPAGKLKAGDILCGYESRTFDTASVAKDVLLGSLLGDGSIRSTHGGTQTAHICLHNSEQPKYLDWKLRSLSFLKFHPNSTGGYTSVNTTELYGYLKMFCNGESTVRLFPTDLDLTDRMVAVWYMDDGHLQNHWSARSRKGYTNFTPWLCRRRGMSNQHQRDIIRTALAAWLECPLHDIKLTSRTIKFSVAVRDSFFARVAPFVIPSMQYKLPPKFRGKWTKDTFKAPQACLAKRPLRLLEVIAPKRKNVPLTRYDLTVAGTGCYFAGSKEMGMLVHNSPGGRALRHSCSIRARVRRCKGGQLKKGDRIIGLVGIIRNIKNKAGGGSQQSLEAGFKVKWSVSPARVEFMSKEEAEELLKA